MDEIKWGPNWSGTRMHALLGLESMFKNGEGIAECGTRAYRIPPTEYCAAAVAKGIPRCRVCEKIVAKTEQK